MYKLTDAMLVELFGQDLYDKCIADSNRLAGNAFFDVILAAAIGRLHDDQQKLLKAQANLGALGN